MAESIDDVSGSPNSGLRAAAEFKGKIALLTNFLPPYRIKVLELLMGSVGALRIFVSVQMESNRRWNANWGALDVTVQRSLSWSSRDVHGNGFQEDRTIHFPYDTVFQLRSYRPDAIIASEFGLRTVQAALYKCLFPRTKLLVWATISLVTEKYRGALRKLVRRLILKVADGVLVNGSSGAAYIEGLGYPRRRIHVVPQATDNDLFAGPSVRADDRVCKLLYTGQLIERKGLAQFHEQLSKWCSLHPDREISWTLVGTGPLRETVESWKRPANYALNLLDEVPYRELPAHYHRADIFTLPALADEWGLVVNEAMIAGLPVLGSVYSQAVEDLVAEGQNGWRFRPDHSDEVFEALSRALDCSRETWNTMRAKAIETVKPIGSMHMKDLILRALDDACG
jgi:glycosyltransferase involved in cell wall biosynthesis